MSSQCSCLRFVEMKHCSLLTPQSLERDGILSHSRKGALQEADYRTICCEVEVLPWGVVELIQLQDISATLHSGVIPWVEKKSYFHLTILTCRHKAIPSQTRSSELRLPTLSSGESATGRIGNVQSNMTSSSSLTARPSFTSHPPEVITVIQEITLLPDMLIKLFT